MKLKNILPISLIVFPWLILLPFLCQIAQFEQLSQWLFANTIKPVYSAFPFILAMNVLCDYAFVWETEELAEWNLLVKVLLIPVYLVIYWLNVKAQSALTILVLLAGLLHLTSASYGIRVLIREKKEKKMKLFPVLILALCHFLIVVDVAAALFLRHKLKSYS